MGVTNKRAPEQLPGAIYFIARNQHSLETDGNFEQVLARPIAMRRLEAALGRYSPKGYMQMQTLRARMLFYYPCIIRRILNY